MKKVRIGNDIIVEWAILSAGDPVNLVGRNIELNLRNIKTVIPITDFIITGNIISFQFAGKDQQELGTYSLTLIENNHNEDMHTVDTCNAFQLVASTCKIYDEECDCFSPCTIHLSSDIHIYDGPISARMIPPDGKAGQVLKKRSDKDFDTAWGEDEGITEIAPGAVIWDNLSTEVTKKIEDKPGQIVPSTGVNSAAEVFNSAWASAPDDSSIKPGMHSHAENIDTFAGGEGSHAEGIGTRAMGYGAHAEGANTEVKGSAKFGHVGGNGSTVEAEAGFAHGVNAVSRNRAEAVFGKNNDPDSTGKSVFQVGIGENKKHPKTGFQVDSDGTIWIINTNTGSRISLQSWLNDIQLKKIVVDQLPETGAPSTVYLLRVTAPDENRHNFFEEYIYVDGAWEMLGTSDTDELIIERILSNPAFKVDSQQIADKAIQTKHLSDGCVTADAIQDGAIGNEKIADGTITRDLLAPVLAGELDTIVHTTSQELTTAQQEQVFGNLGINTVYLNYATDVGNVLPEELIAKIADASRIVLYDPDIGRLVLQLGFADSRSHYFITIRSNGTLYRGVMNRETGVFHTEILSFVDQTSVKFNVSQQLTDPQKTTARTNIGAQKELTTETTAEGNITISGLTDKPVEFAPAGKVALYTLKLAVSDTAAGGYTLEGTTEELEAAAGEIASNPHARVYLDCSALNTTPTPIPMSIILADAENGIVYLEADPYIYEGMIHTAGVAGLDACILVAIGPDLQQVIVRKSVSEGIKKRLFIDLWNEACEEYGTYNAETGYFELNGLTDITYNEAVHIYNAWSWGKSGHTFISIVSFNHIHIRTCIPVRSLFGTDNRDLKALCLENGSMECVNIQIAARISSLYYSFFRCGKLRTIIGILKLNRNTMLGGAFDFCYALETVYINGLQQGISFAHSSKISLQSLMYMIDNSGATNNITITVHADVYAKLTGDTTNAAAAALTPEESAQWMALVETAAAKNITFATT